MSPGHLAHFYGGGFSFIYLRPAGVCVAGGSKVVVIRETTVWEMLLGVTLGL